MDSHYKRLDNSKRNEERAARLKQHLPPTLTPPDNVYFDGDAFSWEFAIDGHRATRNFMVAGARKDFPPTQSEEIITLINPVKDAELNFEILDRDRTVRALGSYRRAGDMMPIAEGVAFRIITGAAIVEYVVEYRHQEPLVEDFSPEESSE